MNRVETIAEKFYYEKDGNTVRDTRYSDLTYLAEKLRCDDLRELWASYHTRPYTALCYSYAHSSLCMTALIKGEPFAIFGCNPDQRDISRGAVWFLSTDKLMEVRLEFIRYSRHFVDIMLEMHPVLFNYVDARNKKSIFWLRQIGAKVYDAAPWGLDGLPFHYFEFKKHE